MRDSRLLTERWALLSSLDSFLELSDEPKSLEKSCEEDSEAPAERLLLSEPKRLEKRLDDSERRLLSSERLLLSPKSLAKTFPDSELPDSERRLFSLLSLK